MMHFPCLRFPPIYEKFFRLCGKFSKFYLFPRYVILFFRRIHLLFTYFLCISFPPTFTMMHLCISQCTVHVLDVPASSGGSRGSNPAMVPSSILAMDFGLPPTKKNIIIPIRSNIGL